MRGDLFSPKVRHQLCCSTQFLQGIGRASIIMKSIHCLLVCVLLASICLAAKVHSKNATVGNSSLAMLRGGLCVQLGADHVIACEQQISCAMSWTWSCSGNCVACPAAQVKSVVPGYGKVQEVTTACPAGIITGGCAPTGMFNCGCSGAPTAVACGYYTDNIQLTGSCNTS